MGITVLEISATPRMAKFSDFRLLKTVKCRLIYEVDLWSWFMKLIYEVRSRNAVDLGRSWESELNTAIVALRYLNQWSLAESIIPNAQILVRNVFLSEKSCAEIMARGLAHLALLIFRYVITWSVISRFKWASVSCASESDSCDMKETHLRKGRHFYMLRAWARSHLTRW